NRAATGARVDDRHRLEAAERGREVESRRAPQRPERETVGLRHGAARSVPRRRGAVHLSDRHRVDRRGMRARSSPRTARALRAHRPCVNPTVQPIQALALGWAWAAPTELTPAPPGSPRPGNPGTPG